MRVPQYGMGNVHNDYGRAFYCTESIKMAKEWNRTALKRLRSYALLSQSQLAKQTGIPIKTIQQYEQGQKDIRHARVDSVIALSRALSCRVEDLVG